jgi:hypothetical protein
MAKPLLPSLLPPPSRKGASRARGKSDRADRSDRSDLRVVAPAEDRGLEELRQIQQTFSTALFRRLVAGDQLQPRWTDGRATAEVMAEFIAPNDRLTPVERIEIYSRSYWYRLIDCLYDDYPGVRAIVGERKFLKLITAYLAKYPSASYTARDLGSRFEQFIRATPETVAPHFGLALDSARFEWAQVVAFDSEAKPPLALDAALGADPTALKLGLQPYLTLLELAYPIDDFIIALRKRERMQSGASNTTAEQTEHEKIPRVRKPKPARIFIAVHRQDNSLFYKRLDAVAFAILKAIQEGKSLAKACDEGAAVADPGADLAAEIRDGFHLWASLGWLCERSA